MISGKIVSFPVFGYIFPKNVSENILVILEFQGILVILLVLGLF